MRLQIDLRGARRRLQPVDDVVEHFVRHADGAGLFESDKARRGVGLADAIAFFVVEDIDPGDIQSQCLCGVDGQFRHLLRGIDAFACAAERDVRLEVARSRAPFHRSGDLIADHQKAHVASVAGGDVLLKDEIRLVPRIAEQAGEIVELIAVLAQQDAGAACRAKFLHHHRKAQLPLDNIHIDGEFCEDRLRNRQAQRRKHLQRLQLVCARFNGLSAVDQRYAHALELADDSQSEIGRFAARAWNDEIRPRKFAVGVLGPPLALSRNNQLEVAWPQGIELNAAPLARLDETADFGSFGHAVCDIIVKQQPAAHAIDDPVSYRPLRASSRQKSSSPAELVRTHGAILWRVDRKRVFTWSQGPNAQLPQNGAELPRKIRGVARWSLRALPCCNRQVVGSASWGRRCGFSQIGTRSIRAGRRLSLSPFRALQPVILRGL